MNDLMEQVQELINTVAAPRWPDRARDVEAAIARSNSLSREERDEVWRACKAAWRAYQAHQVQQTERAERLVDDLEARLAALEEQLAGSTFKDAARDFQGALNNARALSHSQRQDLWNRYQRLWEHRKALTAARGRASELARAEYAQDLLALDFSYDGAAILQSFSNWARVGHKVRAAREKLKSLQAAVKRDERLRPRERKAVFDSIQDYWFKVRQEEEVTFRVHAERAGELYNAAHSAVDNLKLAEAAAILKAHGAEVRTLWLSSRDRQNFREWFDELWQRLHARRNEAHAEWRGRQEAGLGRLEAARDRLLDALERVRSNIRLNESKLGDAWSDGYRQRVSEWIREGEERERDMARSLDDLETKIADARDRLSR